jgi:tetratricopeptide (TPR) repeat protein
VPPDVVITGNRLRDALDKCLARGCPPEDEVDAAMKAGMESFSAGRYEEAKAILRSAISRNKKYAARMPGPISDLYSTYADVTEHEGDEQAFRYATRESVAVVRDALGRDHAQALSVSGRLGDMWAKLGDPANADRVYRAVAGEAERAGKTDIAAGLTFRRAWLALSIQDLARARSLLEQLERSYGKDARFARVLPVLRARIAIAKGDERGTDELIAALRGAGGTEPVMLHEPRYPEFSHAGPLVASEDGSDTMSARINAAFDSPDIKWADIGYWVRPDGRPGEVEILRPAKGAQWARPLVKHVEARRFLPVKADASGVGTYRVERFTLRPSYGAPIGSLVTRRTGAPRLHVIDLTKLAQRDDPPRP